MRTTLDLDEDILQAAKENGGRNVRNGVPVLPRRAAAAPRPSLQLVNELRDDG